MPWHLRGYALTPARRNLGGSLNIFDHFWMELKFQRGITFGPQLLGPFPAVPLSDCWTFVTVWVFHRAPTPPRPAWPPSKGSFEPRSYTSHIPPAAANQSQSKEKAIASGLSPRRKDSKGGSPGGMEMWSRLNSLSKKPGWQRSFLDHPPDSIDSITCVGKSHVASPL